MVKENFSDGPELEVFSLDKVLLCQSPNYLLSNNANFSQICLTCNAMIVDQYRINLVTPILVSNLLSFLMNIFASF